MTEMNASNGEGIQAASCVERDRNSGNVGIPRKPAHGCFRQPTIITHEILTYADLLRQIRNDLRMQHPEWIQANGESPMCDSYEARILKLLGGSTGSGSGKTVAFQDKLKWSATRHSILKV